MYIYFNKEGIITTQIPHGEVIRQGGTFTLSFFFEGIEDVSQYSLSIAFKRPGDKEFGTIWPISTAYPSSNEPFKKIRSNEMTYSFVEGKKYKLYDYECNLLTGASEKYGNVQALVKLCDENSLTFNESSPQSVKKVIVEGLIQFYVEKSYGDNYNTNITMDQFNALLTYLNSGIDGIKKSYIKSINYEQKTFKITVTKQNDETLEIDLPIETIQNDLEEIKKAYIKTIEYDSEKFLFTITKQDGESKTIDLPIETLVDDVVYENHIIKVTMVDKNEYTIDLNEMYNPVVEANWSGQNNSFSLSSVNENISNSRTILKINVSDKINKTIYATFKDYLEDGFVYSGAFKDFEGNIKTIFFYTKNKKDFVVSYHYATLPKITATAEVIEANSPANVEVSGDNANVNFNFQIPKGADGYGVQGFEIDENGDLILYSQNVNTSTYEIKNGNLVVTLDADGVKKIKTLNNLGKRW